MAEKGVEEQVLAMERLHHIGEDLYNNYEDSLYWQRD